MNKKMKPTKTTTPLIRNSINRASLRRSFLLIVLTLALACFALSPMARAVSPAPNVGQQLVPIQDTPDARVLLPSSVPLDKSTPVHIGLGFSGFNKKASDEFFATLIDPNSPNFQAWIPTREFGVAFWTKR